MGHYSILTDKFLYFSHFGNDDAVTSFPSIAPHIWNPIKSVHDIQDLNDYAVLRMKRTLLLYLHNNDTTKWEHYWWINCAKREISELLLAEQDEEAFGLLQQVVLLDRDPNSLIPSEPSFLEMHQK